MIEYSARVRLARQSAKLTPRAATGALIIALFLTMFACALMSYAAVVVAQLFHIWW